MPWAQTSPYSITDGRNVISKMLGTDGARYLLWRWNEARGKAVLHPSDSYFTSAQAAMAAAESQPEVTA